MLHALYPYTSGAFWYFQKGGRDSVDQWDIYAAFRVNTGQKVKRTLPGGEGLTMDPFSEKALGRYLSRFEKAFGEDNPDISNFFNNSYEVYGCGLHDRNVS